MRLKHLARCTVPIWVCTVAIMALSLTVRLHGLGDKPYWLDEATTLHRASLPLAALVRDSLGFHHLPLYFVVSSWFEPFGLDERTMRLPAALFGAASCVLAFLSGRALAGWRCGLAAALLLTVSPFQVQYAQEARSYTLVTSFILLALWGLIRLARHGRVDRPGWLLYAIGTAFALDTLSVALLWFLAAQLAAIAIAASDPNGRPRFATTWLLVQLAILAAYLPFAVGMLVLTHGDLGSGLDWVPPLTLRDMWITLQSVYLLRLSSLIAFRLFDTPLDIAGIPCFGIAVAALVVLGLWRAHRSAADRLAVRIVVIAFATLPIVLAVASLHASVWMPRYLAWSGPVFFLLAGLGVARLPRPATGPILASILLAGLVNLRPYYRAETRPLWNVAAATLRDRLHPGDLIVTDDPAAISMMNVELPTSAARFGPSDWTTDPAIAIAARQAGHHVWAVHGTVGQNDRTRLRTLLDHLHGLGQPESISHIGLDITLLDYAPNASAGGSARFG
jgi:mannosyltransferase